MDITYFRSSSINVYRMCGFSYYLNFCLGLKTVPVNNKADKGSSVHKILEVLANLKLLQQNNQPMQYEDDALGKIECNDLFDNHFIQELIRRATLHYAEKSPHMFTKADAKHINQWTHLVLGTDYDPRVMNIVAPEGQFSFEIQKPGFELPNGGYLKLQGTIDLVVQQDDETYELVDWKTGAFYDWVKDEPKTFDGLLKDHQLRLYHYVLATHLYPNIKNWIISICFIKDGGPRTLVFPDEYIQQTEDYIKRLYHHVLENTNPQCSRSWKCSKLCYYGRTQHSSGQTICNFYRGEMDRLGMEEVTKKYTEKGFTLDYYEAPG